MPSRAAWTLARCVPVVEKDDKLDEAKRRAEMQFYADQAMAMLRDAVAKGYKNADDMKTDKDLDPLREREDFKKVVAELEAAKEGAAEETVGQPVSPDRPRGRRLAVNQANGR